MKYLAALAIAAAAPAAAQQHDGTPPPVAVAQAGPVDPAKLVLARKAVDAVWPLGTYARLMGGQFQDMMDNMMGSMMGMRAADMSPVPGPAGSKSGDQTGDKTMGEVMAEADPHFEERLRIMNRVMMAEMSPIMDRMEPAVREGLSRSFARKFSVAQLEDLNRFFATPTGAMYASESMLLAMDPEVMSAMMKMVPELMKEMPNIMARLEAATAHLPPPPKPVEKEEE